MADLLALGCLSPAAEVVPAEPYISRFLAKITFDTEGGHWLWTGAAVGTGSSTGRQRYGHLRIAPPSQPPPRFCRAHRFGWALWRGPLDPELVLDHVADVCGLGLCVNPDHLEPVTYAENVARRNAAMAATPWGAEF